MRTCSNLFLCALLAAAWCIWPGCASAQARSVVLDDLTSLRDFAAPYSAPALSSDGGRLAFVTRTTDLESDAYLHEVHVVETVAPFRHRVIATAGDIVLGSIRGRRSGVPIDRVALWSPDDVWIAYLVGRDAYAELWRVRSDGRDARRVSEAGEHVVSFSWAPDDALVYRTAISAEALAATRAEARRFGFHADNAFEPIYDVAPRIDDASPVAAWRVDVRAGRRAQLAWSQGAQDAAPARIVPADARFADAESPELALEAAFDGGVRRCTHALCQGELIEAWAASGDSVLFQRQTGHGALTELSEWSLRDDRVRPIRVTEARLSGCLYDRARLFCLEDASTQPQRLVAIDSATGVLQVLWDPNPSWSQLRMPQVERFDTVNPGGQASFAHLVYPLDYVEGRRYPLVIVQYRSRGFLRGGTGGEHPIFPLSTRGYFVLSVDRPEDLERARIMDPNTFLVAAELDGSEHAMKAIALEHFLDVLEARGLIDPDRIAITGMSDGTETLFHMLLTSERRFAAAVTSSPPPDPSSWALFSADFRVRRAASGAMAPWSAGDSAWADYWRRISPIYHIERIRTPILFNLAETETLPAMPLIARLQDMAAPYDLYVYPGAYHNKWRPAQVRSAQTRALAWIDLWLRDVDTADAHEVGRTVRWRSMRNAQSADLP